MHTVSLMNGACFKWIVSSFGIKSTVRGTEEQQPEQKRAFATKLNFIHTSESLRLNENVPKSISDMHLWRRTRAVAGSAPFNICSVIIMPHVWQHTSSSSYLGS